MKVISNIFSDKNGMKLGIKHRKMNKKHLTNWRLNSMLPKKKWVNEEIKNEIKKYLQTIDHEITSIQNLLDAAKAVLRGKFIVTQAFLKYQVSNNRNYHLKELEKKGQTKPKFSRRKK